MSPAFEIQPGGDRTAMRSAESTGSDGNLCHPVLAYVRTLIGKLIKAERDDHASTDEEALKSIGRRCGVTQSTLENIAKRDRAKDVRGTVIERIETAYLDLCERQYAHWKHELLIARKATPDAVFTDLERASENMAALLADARAASLAGRVRRGLAERGIRRSARSDDHLNTQPAAGAGVSSSLPHVTAD